MTPIPYDLTPNCSLLASRYSNRPTNNPLPEKGSWKVISVPTSVSSLESGIWGLIEWIEREGVKRVG